MSQLLITQYLNELNRLRKISGTKRETVVREAFKELLKAWGKTRDLQFIAEYRIVTASKNQISVDGALLHSLRVPFGYWEAKDEEDDLDAQIAKKFRKGYPRDNIIFENSISAALIQHGAEIFHCKVDDPQQLEMLLKLFFDYERAEIADFRKAVAQFKVDLPEVLKALRDMINKEEADDAGFREAQIRFLKHAQETINPAVTAADVREMLIQHILTEDIFAKVFNESDFHRQNNVAKELYDLEAKFFIGAVKKNTLRSLEPYYAAILAAAALISTHSEKQAFLKLIYENFYKVYNPKAADRLGVIYTPNEIVRFMIESADWLCEKHFGRRLIDEGVEILDPATGTGTFICELLEHFRGQPLKLRHKYKEELHANEVAILPYYVANLNIEATFAAISGQYAEFPNLCFVDTLDNVAGLGKFSGHQEDLFGAVSEENVARIKRQNKRKISVIIGNPPYNANQQNENDNNKNRTYPRIDERIKATYIKESTAQKTKLYDMYARFFRWASDRLRDDGIIAFVSNRSFIDSRTFDGFRKVVARDFNEIYVVDLGGDVRANPKLSGTKHNVFGIQTGVAISFLVKRTGETGCRSHYARRPEMETADEKLAFLSTARIAALAFDEVRPDAKQNWINQTDNDFDSFIPIASKETKAAKTPGQERAIFKLFSLGVVTARDEWVYNFSPALLETSVRYLIDTYNAEVARPKATRLQHNERLGIKWSRAVKRDLEAGKTYKIHKSRIITANYRPFVCTYMYRSNDLNEMPNLTQKFFGSGEIRTPSITVMGDSSGKPYFCLAIDRIPDLNFVSPASGETQTFALSRLDEHGVQLDNITDWALEQFKSHYKKPEAQNPSQKPRPHPEEGSRSEPVSKDGPERSQGAPALRDAAFGGSSGRGLRTKAPHAGTRAITKDAIFHYVYGVLHDPVYREKYAQNLKREFPRIPFYPDFWRWADWGETLMQLHIGYESVEPWPLARIDTSDEKAATAGVAQKPILKADKEHGIIVLDSETQLSGVPREAWDYRLGNRCALEWILDQYKEKTPKDPTIREKFNTYRFADYKEKVIDLLTHVTRVSVETQRIVEAMKGAVQ